MRKKYKKKKYEKKKDEKEEEQVFIASAKGRYGPESPNTPQHAIK